MDGRLGSGMAQPRWLDQVKEPWNPQALGAPHSASRPHTQVHLQSCTSIGSLSVRLVKGRRDGMLPVYEGRKKSIMELVIGGASLVPNYTNYTKRTVRSISLGRHVTPDCPPLAPVK